MEVGQEKQAVVDCVMVAASEMPQSLYAQINRVYEVLQVKPVSVVDVAVPLFIAVFKSF